MRVISSDYDEAPTLLAVRSNTVSVTQAETIEAEVLGDAGGHGIEHGPWVDTLVSG